MAVKDKGNTRPNRWVDMKAVIKLRYGRAESRIVSLCFYPFTISGLEPDHAFPFNKLVQNVSDFVVTTYRTLFKALSLTFPRRLHALLKFEYFVYMRVWMGFTD